MKLSDSNNTGDSRKISANMKMAFDSNGRDQHVIRRNAKDAEKPSHI